MMRRIVKDDTKGLSQDDLHGSVSLHANRQLHWMEEIMMEAERNGDFADLPGKGKPLALKERDPYGGIEADLYGYLKEAGFVPEWIELRRKITDQINWLRETPRHPERPSRLVEVNLLIEKHNRLIPNPHLTLPKVPRDFGLETRPER